MVSYQYHFRYTQFRIFEELNDSYNDTEFTDLIVHSNFIWLVSNFRYMHRFMYHPSAINNYKNFWIELYILPFSWTNDRDCLRLNPHDSNSFNNELEYKNRDTLTYTLCEYSEAEDFETECDYWFTKINDSSWLNS